MEGVLKAVWQRRDEDGLWLNRLYGQTYRGLGPAHGAVGNVLTLLQGNLLSADRRKKLEQETAAVLSAAAMVEDGVANWPRLAGSELVDEDGEIKLQWCAGAPGIVISAASYLDEDLVRAGAELAWRAGPAGMEKGPCICHGTAGNG